MLNFKRNTTVYLIDESGKYQLEVYSDISASQTFDEQRVKRKTLHAPLDLHDHATITKASPANFSFTVPIFDRASLQKELDLATTYSSGTTPYFDLYFVSDDASYKIEKATFEGVTFNFSRDSIITVTFTGSGSRLYKATLPAEGAIIKESIGANYSRVSTLDIDLMTTQIGAVVELNLEFTNDVEWTKNDTLQETLDGNIIYPTNYVLKGRQVSGSFTEYLTDTNIDQLYDTTTSTSIDIKINPGSPNFLRFFLPSTVFTRRQTFGDVFTRTYDFRLNTNSQFVKPIYKGV